MQAATFESSVFTSNQAMAQAKQKEKEILEIREELNLVKGALHNSELKEML